MALDLLNDDYLDSRELIDYLEELKDDFLTDYNSMIEELNEESEQDEDFEPYEEAEDFDEIDEELLDTHLPDYFNLIADFEEIELVQAFVDELEGYGDFSHGEVIISRDHFADYCKEMLQDCGDLPRDLPSYIESNIDWDGVADDLEADYVSAYYGNREYLMRA